jgi:diguanylate cyclase (GGDEF)-like protein/PAS domain S-box-containing protein
MTKIMVVEDERIIAMDIRGQLQQLGYEVVALAISGEQAINLAAERRPQLILMDIVLKGAMDGITAAGTIAETLHIPIIFLTAYSDDITLSRAKMTRSYGFLIKPFRVDELHSTIEMALYKHQADRQIEESRQWFYSTLKCINDGVIATDSEARIQFMNPFAEALTGEQFTNIKGADIGNSITLLDEKSHNPIANPVSTTLTLLNITRPEGTTLLVDKTGRQLPVEVSVAPILNKNGKLLGAVMTLRDLTTHRFLEGQVQDLEARNLSAFNDAAIGMGLVDLTGHFLQVNIALSTIFGYSGQELLQYSLDKLIQIESQKNLVGHNLIQLFDSSQQSFQIEVNCHHKTNGKVVWVLLNASLVRDAADKPKYFIIQTQDISERKFAEHQLVYLANHDPLTDLCNRTQFEDRLAQAVSLAGRHETKLAILFLDLDRFKLINDTLGHRMGDLLLKSVSTRLVSLTRANDTVARVGGDEFIILLNDISTVEDIARVAQKILEQSMQPFFIEGHNIVVTTSIGISVYPEDGESGHILMKNADTAMYLAKERGKNTYRFYTLEMTSRSLEKMTIERDLRLALINDELKLYYQPQISPNGNALLKVEALVRWQHPTLGLIYPDRFIKVAEETGLIIPLGAWVLRTACLQVKQWQDNDGAFIHVGVNLSARQFQESGLFESIKQIIEETGIKPSSLELEITESAVMQDLDRTLQILQDLHELGIKLSIDDFGTGYSSLTYLRRFPVDGVKIDRSFILGIPQDKDSMTLVRGIIALAHELRLQVTAEGVETEDQLAFLIAHHCDVIQGYIISQPVTAKQLDNYDETVSFTNLLATRH